MSKWNKLLKICFTGLAYFGARVLYRPLSKFMQLCFESRYTKMPDDTPWNPEELDAFLKTCEWRPDPLGGVFDYVSKAEKFFETKRGDCDEFASFSGEVIHRIACMLSVVWFEPNAKGLKKFQGHNVCFYMDTDGLWHHISNWGISKGYEDYMDLIKDIPPQGTIPCVFSMRDSKTLRWITGGLVK